MFRRFFFLLTTAMLAGNVAHADLIDPGTDLFYRFTGTIVREEIAVGPDVVADPEFIIGGRVYGEIALNWESASYTDGIVSSFSSDAIYFYGGHTKTWVEYGDDGGSGPGDGNYLHYGLWYDPEIRVENSTGNLITAIGGTDGQYDYVGFFSFSDGTFGGTVQQIANASGMTTPSHYFYFLGSWENVRSVPRPVPEPAVLALLVTACLGLAVLRRRRG